jgi:hypothetical protein
MARIAALGHLSNIVSTADAEGGVEEQLAQIRLEADCAKELVLRASGSEQRRN